MRNSGRWLLLLSALIFFAGTASADTAGVVGSIASLQVNTTSADAYLQYHGRIIVKNVDKNLDEYRWGGTSCGSKVLTEAQVAELHAALDNKKMLIAPLYQAGQGQALCVVGFTLVPKQNLKFVMP
jgi:hypothetical protein